MADAAQDDSEVGFPYRAASAQRTGRSRPKQPVREAVELARAAFERVGQPVDDRFEQLREDARTGNARDLRGRSAVGEARKRGQSAKRTVIRRSRVRTNPTGVDIGSSGSAVYIKGKLR